MFHIAAFYRFTEIQDPAAIREEILVVCGSNDVKGTILLAPEGLNGTIAGPQEGIENVLDHLRSLDEIDQLPAKHSTATSDPFLRLKVRIKKEIVTLGVGTVDTRANTGEHVPASDWNELISDPDVTVVDTRNTYEVAIGSFEGATDPHTRSFTEFPDWITATDGLAKDTKLAMFCTGGIRCEKATAYLAEQGFTNLFQLEGGILKYLESVPEADSMWDGECYVFDRRVSVGHGLVPGTMEVCPNCNVVVNTEARGAEGYRTGVTCPECFDTITDDRKARFAERQRQIDLAAERGTQHLGRVS
ncbi:MAG: rhodanese-related sulfurtransferase [Acidimicrobiia bacterium]